MIGIFLDDERNPKDVKWMVYSTWIEWTVVRNHIDFFDVLPEQEWDFISLDHDLHDFTEGVEYTGYDILKVMVDTYMQSSVCILPVGECSGRQRHFNVM